MNTKTQEGISRFERLVTLSRTRFYNPFSEFDWPEALPADQYWLSPELLTIGGTRYLGGLSEEQLVALSRWESINFYSLSMYGERDLSLVVLDHIHSAGHEDESEYFHHFLEEENKHMWFFSQFCLRYGGKLYPNKALKFLEFGERDIRSFVSFAKIMIFEEIGDYYNVRLRDDERLPPFVRSLNGFHHMDESRHLAMGRLVLARMHEGLRAGHPAERLADIERYLKAYMRSSLDLFYNPAVYRDAGLPDPYGMRRELCADAARRVVHRQVLKRVLGFFVEARIFETEEIYDDAAAAGARVS